MTRPNMHTRNTYNVQRFDRLIITGVFSFILRLFDATASEIWNTMNLMAGILMPRSYVKLVVIENPNYFTQPVARG